MKKLIKKIIPPFLLSFYHWKLSFLGALFYGFPSRKMNIIGVTGTKGKTTVCNLIFKVLNFNDFKTGMVSTLNFGIGKKEWVNSLKQTMPGRFKLQKFLSQMVNQECKYGVVETSSEGILQYRHSFIDYDVAIFTNLSPEHIERHGSFENYRKAKIKLFKKVAKKKNGIGVYNLDDENVDHFLKPNIQKKYGYTLKDVKIQDSDIEIVKADNMQVSENGIDFQVRGVEFHSSLLGEFNIYNCLSTICFCISQGIELERISKALKKIDLIEGRMQLVEKGQDFKIIVDYSYEATSLKNALKAVRVFNPNRVIVIFGSAGGGRDVWRRPIMGKIADKYADIIIVTTDDPYEEKPENIVNDILKGVFESKRRILNKDVFVIVDRREAIKKSLKLVQKNDLILLAGKGGEEWMNVEGGKKIPWNDKEIISKELEIHMKK